MTYFDTAYIVKCYMKEEVWQPVRNLLASKSASPARYTEARIACGAATEDSRERTPRVSYRWR